MFSFLSNCQTIFQRNGTILHSYQWCMRVLIFSISSPTLLVVFLFDYSVKCCLTVVLVTIEFWEFFIYFQYKSFVRSPIMNFSVLDWLSSLRTLSFSFVLLFFPLRLNLFSVPTTQCCCKDTMMKLFWKLSSTLKSHVLILSYSVQWNYG